jgi:hypothetical protein
MKENIMSINIKRKRSATAALGATVAAAAIPALLFLGAGTAQAGGSVWNNADYLGTTVFVQSDGGTWGNCTYNAWPAVGVGIPSGPRHFILPAWGEEELWFPGVKLNTTWNVNVTCDNGPAINTTSVY